MTYPPNRVPKVIGVLIGIMLGGFILCVTAPGTVLPLFGLVPHAVTQKFWLWQPITYMALHGGLLHLLFNMFALYMFGTSLAILWGDRRFLVYFIYCGVAAAALTIGLGPVSVVATIGASGAIYGLIYAWAKEFPESVIYIWGFIPVRAKHLALLLFIMEFALSQVPSPIARFAHLGGLLAGVAYCHLPSLLHDWFEVSMTRSTVKPERRTPMKKEPQNNEDVDKILEKINNQGLDKLTDAERSTLESASKKLKQGKH